MPVKFVDIKLDYITGVTTKIKKSDSGKLIGTIQIEGEITPELIARLLNLQKQGVPLFASIGTDQLAMDLKIEAFHPITGEIGKP
jgi:hypothetical protein